MTVLKVLVVVAEYIVGVTLVARSMEHSRSSTSAVISACALSLVGAVVICATCFWWWNT